MHVQVPHYDVDVVDFEFGPFDVKFDLVGRSFLPLPKVILMLFKSILTIFNWFLIFAVQATDSRTKYR